MQVNTSNGNQRAVSNTSPIDSASVSGPHSRTGWQSAVPDILLHIQTEMFQRGSDRAEKSGALQPNADDLLSLQEHARSVAREAHREIFNPDKNEHDRLRQAEFEKQKVDLIEAELAGKHGDANINKMEEELAHAQAGNKPTPPSLPTTAAVITIMVTVAPTLHDLVFVMTDDFLSWLFSILGGLAWGVFISIMILFVSEDDVDRSRLINRIGLASGFGMSLAIGAIRLREAASIGDVIFAVGLTLLEAFIVLGLEAIATQYRPAYQRWAQKHMLQTQAEDSLKAARAQRERWQHKQTTLLSEIRQHISYVEERAIRFLNIDQIEAALVKAITDGYHHGIKLNVSRVLGIKANI